MKDEIHTVKEAVIHLLEQFPEARNNDTYLEWLFLRYVRKIDLPWESFEKLRSFSLETVRRCRQLIQSGGNFLPTNPDVLRRRRKREQSFSEVLRSE